MSWRDLLNRDVTISTAWTGTLSVFTWSCQYRTNNTPPEYGWYSWQVSGRNASDPQAIDPNPELLRDVQYGYLVGDRFVAENTRHSTLPDRDHCVYLIEEGLERFTRVSVGRAFPDGPLVFRQLEYPVGAEHDVLEAFLDRQTNTNAIKGIHPALDLAFRFECHQREVAEKRRQELEEQRRQEAERQALEARRKELVERLGDGAGRRAVASVDFVEAARAALAVGGAVLLDHRAGRRGEHVIKFRLLQRRFECICDDQLRVTDSGICLVDHRTGEKGDTRFTLESLPGVIKQADYEDKLVVFRHV